VQLADLGDGFTKRARTVLIGTVLALLVGNAAALVAYDGAGTGGGNPGQAQASDASSPSDAAAAALASKAASSAGKAAKATGSGKASPNRSSGSSGSSTTSSSVFTPTSFVSQYSYQVELQPTCARVGEEFTITFRMKRYATAGLIAVYADGQTYRTMYAETSKEDGIVVYKWIAPPAPGQAKMYTSATDYETQKTGTTHVLFRIVEATGTC
jgi:hypothetical protein